MLMNSLKPQLHPSPYLFCLLFFMLLQTNSLFNLHVFILILQVYIYFFYKQSQFLCVSEGFR